MAPSSLPPGAQVTSAGSYSSLRQGGDRVSRHRTVSGNPSLPTVKHYASASTHHPHSALVEGNTNSVVTLLGHRVGKDMVFTSFADGLASQSSFAGCSVPYCSHCWPGELPS